MNDGHFVAAIDGLKIEPLPLDLSGVAADGSRHPFRPIRDVASLVDSLDDRVMAGFGGVAEYGITVRWDKNFLKIVRLLLERRAELPHVWRGAVRRHDHDRQRLCDGLRPCRAVRRRRPPDRDPDAEQSRAGRAPSLRFPDGVAADRGGQDRQHRQSDRAAAGRRHRRRADRDRHRDRVAGLLPGPGREVPRALRDACRRARRRAGARRMERGRARGRRPNSSPMAGRSAPSARPRAARAARRFWRI